MSKRTQSQRVSIQRVTGNNANRTRDQVTIEEPLELRLQFELAGQPLEKNIAITMRTPGEDYELAAGFLLGEGIIRSHKDILQFHYCVGAPPNTQQFNSLRVTLRPTLEFDPARLLRHFYSTSSCGICGKASLEALELQGHSPLPNHPTPLDAALIHTLPKRLREAQLTFEKTGGLHAAALFDWNGQLLHIYEDIGRHNAVDKVFGARLLNKEPPNPDSLLLVSGRVSFELMQKTLAAQTPIIASIGAPSSLAIDLAKQFNITLLCFVREDGFNIYHGEHRIKIS